jgi:hypothetical protein
MLLNPDGLPHFGHCALLSILRGRTVVIALACSSSAASAVSLWL